MSPLSLRPCTSAPKSRQQNARLRAGFSDADAGNNASSGFCFFLLFFLCGGVFGGEGKLHGKMLLAFFIRKFVKFPTAACGLGSARKTI